MSNSICAIAIAIVLTAGWACWGQDEQSFDFEKFKSDRLEEIDKLSRLSRNDHERLWKHNIELKVRSKNEKIKLDAFGVAATGFIDKLKPQMCAEFMRSIGDEIVGVEMEFNDLEEVLLKLKKRVSSEWRKMKSKAAPQIVFRVELIDEFSKVRKKHETWLLVDIYQSDGISQYLARADFERELSERRRPPHHRDDPQTIVLYKDPHPKYLESEYFWNSLPAPKPNRNQTIVTVADDGLDRQEREVVLGFRFTDTTGFESHQLEGLGGSMLDIRDARTQHFLNEAAGLFGERLPRGCIVTPDEIHLRIGSIVRILNRRYGDMELHVTVEKKKIGEGTYSKLRITGTPRR